jgi:hypothetical protein
MSVVQNIATSTPPMIGETPVMIASDMNPASPGITDGMSEDSDISGGVGASFADDMQGVIFDGTAPAEPEISEATRALADMAALRQLGRTVALAPHTQRLEAFTTVAREAAELVLSGVRLRTRGAGSPAAACENDCFFAIASGHQSSLTDGHLGEIRRRSDAGIEFDPH